MFVSGYYIWNQDFQGINFPHPVHTQLVVCVVVFDCSFFVLFFLTCYIKEICLPASLLTKKWVRKTYLHLQISPEVGFVAPNLVQNGFGGFSNLDFLTWGKTKLCLWFYLTHTYSYVLSQVALVTQQQRRKSTLWYELTSWHEKITTAILSQFKEL